MKGPSLHQQQIVWQIGSIREETTDGHPSTDWLRIRIGFEAALATSRLPSSSSPFLPSKIFAKQHDWEATTAGMAIPTTGGRRPKQRERKISSSEERRQLRKQECVSSSGIIWAEQIATDTSGGAELDKSKKSKRKKWMAVMERNVRKKGGKAAQNKNLPLGNVSSKCSTWGPSPTAGSW